MISDKVCVQCKCCKPFLLANSGNEANELAAQMKLTQLLFFSLTSVVGFFFFVAYGVAKS